MGLVVKITLPQVLMGPELAGLRHEEKLQRAMASQCLCVGGRSLFREVPSVSKCGTLFHAGLSSVFPLYWPPPQRRLWLRSLIPLQKHKADVCYKPFWRKSNSAHLATIKTQHFLICPLNSQKRREDLPILPSFLWDYVFFSYMGFQWEVTHLYARVCVWVDGSTQLNQQWGKNIRDGNSEMQRNTLTGEEMEQKEYGSQSLSGRTVTSRTLNEDRPLLHLPSRVPGRHLQTTKAFIMSCKIWEPEFSVLIPTQLLRLP